jgi:hypothetical protein
MGKHGFRVVLPVLMAMSAGCTPLQKYEPPQDGLTPTLPLLYGTERLPGSVCESYPWAASWDKSCRPKDWEIRL